MQNAEAAEQLALQLKGLLRDKTMTHDQLASCYSINQGHSLVQKLKEMSLGDHMTLSAFVNHFHEHFEAVGKNQLKAKALATPTSPSSEGSHIPHARRIEGYGSVNAGPGEGGEEPEEQSMRYSDISQSLRNILKEASGPLPLQKLDALFVEKYQTSVSAIAGMSTVEYLQRKESLFEYNSAEQTVTLLEKGATITAGEMDERFVIKEFIQLIESMGPVTYISTICGKFIQRNGISVTSVISSRPLDLFKRHPDSFLVLGAGNVTLKKYESLPEVQRLMEPAPKAHKKAREKVTEDPLEIPDVITEQHVVEEFRRLILADGMDSVYISSLCGRFLQRFKQPVAAIIDSKPAEFLRRHPDIFVMTGGGNVGLREVLGPDAVSVLPPATRTKPTAQVEAGAFHAALTEKDLRDLEHGTLGQEASQAFMAALEVIRSELQEVSFLAVDRVVVGGPAGHGLHPSHGAEIVVFVRQLPFNNFSQWLPHIVETLTSVLLIAFSRTWQ
ncbi:unnamed protein product [Symbiodinium natans]|uniref:Uncharacterized protein n=1 Tax=Symbiodinium natans TaxID=878477 RepID=A0A812ULD0_9DINO|nr:unnamed protein product [Symbiodinium natans]